MSGEVYFIQCDHRIKIGFSRDPDCRIRELSTAAPAKLKFLGRVPGSRTLETTLHRKLRNHRVAGEWFEDCEPVRAAMLEALESGDCTKEDLRYPELIAALKIISGPAEIGLKVGSAITRAAERVGLPRWRVFDIWYGKARRVEVPEAIMIRDALLSHRSNPPASR